MNCTEATVRLEAWLAGELNEAEARAVEEHAADCEACGARLEAASRFATLPAALPVPSALRSEVLAAVRQARRRHAWRRGLLTASGVAAVALLGIALQPHRKQASDVPNGATLLLASERVRPEMAALTRAEQELVTALAETPGDAGLQRALDDLRRQREALERIVRMAAS